MHIAFDARAHPGQKKTRTEPDYDPYMETFNLRVDGRERLWSVEVQEARDALAEAIARDLEDEDAGSAL